MHAILTWQEISAGCVDRVDKFILIANSREREHELFGKRVARGFQSLDESVGMLPYMEQDVVAASLLRGISNVGLPRLHVAAEHRFEVVFDI